MANYVESIKVGSGEVWPVRDVEAHTALANMLNLVYPVGSIYMSINENNPNTLFGGTWEPIKDVFLLSASDNHPAGETGGEEKHVLTVSETPFYASDNEESGCGLTQAHTFQDRTIVTSPGTSAHNNMPPYLAVYMWKRTA